MNMNDDILEAERRRLAALLDETVIRKLDLLLAQVRAYEQTGSRDPQTALRVIAALVQQALQSTRDLERALHPQTLETLGLAAALEALAGQYARAHGVQVELNVRRRDDRLPPRFELALFRLIQDILDDAVYGRGASRMVFVLTHDPLSFHMDDNGRPPQLNENLRERTAALGGAIQLESRQITAVFDIAIDLTERERQVVALLAQGLTNQQIAVHLGIGARTVKFHLDNVYSKLRVNTRAEAAVQALRRGWIT